MLLDFPKLNYPEGSILHDVRYVKQPESFEVIYFNPITNRLELAYEDPIVDIWFLKEEYRTNVYQIPCAEIDKCYRVICKYSQISRMISENCGGEWSDHYDKYSNSNPDRKSVV